jgi:hypothetical protein
MAFYLLGNLNMCFRFLEIIFWSQSVIMNNKTYKRPCNPFVTDQPLINCALNKKQHNERTIKTINNVSAFK